VPPRRIASATRTAARSPATGLPSTRPGSQTNEHAPAIEACANATRTAPPRNAASAAAAIQFR